MDHHDHDQHHAHPSSSIHNAAYPDSNYMPSGPPVLDDNKLAASTAEYPGPAGQSSGYPHFQHTVQSPPLLQTQLPQHGGFQPNYADGSGPWVGPNSLGVMEPNVPPPPYDPARPATASSASNIYTPTSASPHSPHPHSLHSSPPSPNPSHNDGRALLPPPERPQSAYSAQGRDRDAFHMGGMALPGQSAASSVDKGGLGPVAAARRRRRRKLGICAGVLCLVLLFLIAVIIGIAIGVFKVHNRDDDKPKGP